MDNVDEIVALLRKQGGSRESNPEWPRHRRRDGAGARSDSPSAHRSSPGTERRPTGGTRLTTDAGYHLRAGRDRFRWLELTWRSAKGMQLGRFLLDRKDRLYRRQQAGAPIPIRLPSWRGIARATRDAGPKAHLNATLMRPFKRSFPLITSFMGMCLLPATSHSTYEPGSWQEVRGALVAEDRNRLLPGSNKRQFDPRNTYRPKGQNHMTELALYEQGRLSLRLARPSISEAPASENSQRVATHFALRISKDARPLTKGYSALYRARVLGQTEIYRRHSFHSV